MIRTIKRNKVRALIATNLKKGETLRVNKRLTPVWAAMRVYKAEHEVKLAKKALKKDQKNFDLIAALASAEKTMKAEYRKQIARVKAHNEKMKMGGKNA